jgi:CheY-like chemotaxis protein
MLAAIEPKPLRVLVVDDDSDTVDTTSILLRLIGYKVEAALNGRDALTRASSFQPQVVMLDLGMPAMDGYETARELQRLGSPPVLIAVTGFADIQSRRQAAEAGFDLCLTKPIEPGIYEELPRLVEQSGELRAVHARLNRFRENTRPALTSLAIAHLQTAYTMLNVAGTTENEATKACCLAKTRRICDRLNVWTKRYPYLRDLRDELEDLIRHLPDA